MMIPVILSGGSGTRLWPVSRDLFPKQFCEFFDQSLLRNTYERVAVLGEKPRIVTLDSMGFLTERALAGAGLRHSDLVLEPLGKNTATAIALIAIVLERQGHAEDVMGIFPADHLISDQEMFVAAVKKAEDIAKEGRVVIIGIPPRYAATGYGYVELKEPAKTEGRREPAAVSVTRFIEKPPQAKAEEYLNSGRHFWNAGMFVFQVKKVISLLQVHMPDLWAKMQTLKPDLSNLKYVYANIKGTSIDYGVMEKLNDIICIPADMGWSDVGSWDEIARISEEAGALKLKSEATVFNVGGGENFAFSEQKKLIGFCGVDHLVVVDTPDSVLVAKKGETQRVKDLVEAMRLARVPQTASREFEYRPWGRFDVLADVDDHKVKRITVDPGHQLSYQMHQKRDEHWVFIAGSGEFTLDDKVIQVSAGQHVMIRRGQKHRIRNSGTVPLVFVEVQAGDYFGEDDITRFADDYKRI